jgi:hypothetical protein
MDINPSSAAIALHVYPWVHRPMPDKLPIDAGKAHYVSGYRRKPRPARQGIGTQHI